MTYFKDSNMLKIRWRLFSATLFSLALLNVSALQAQSIISGIAGETKPTETIELTVSPAAAPNPIFKHRFTVLPHKTIPGNAASTYMRSLAEGGLRNPFKRMTRKFGAVAESWGFSRESSDVAKEDILQASSYFDDFVNEYLARATMQRECRWESGLEDLRGGEAIGFSLSFEQETRTMSRVLALQTRAAIIEGDFAKAVGLLRMNYQLGQNVSKTPAIVAALIGISEVGITNQGVEQLIGAENSPNMYWALTELPRPIIDMRRALRLENQWGERLIPELAEADKEHTDEEWNSLLNKLAARFTEGQLMALVQLGVGRGLEAGATSRDPLMATGLGLAAYRSAKKRLVAGGEKQEAVAAMSVSEVLIKDAARELTRISDMSEKESYLPHGLSFDRLNKLEEFFVEEQRFNNPGAYFAGLVLPATLQVRAAQLRVDRDICALRVIEAIRMHAAETGSLPGSLDEIKVVPVPKNPATEKPFRYSIQDGKAILDLPRERRGFFWKRYVIRLRE